MEPYRREDGRGGLSEGKGSDLRMDHHVGKDWMRKWNPVDGMVWVDDGGKEDGSWEQFQL